MKKGILGILLFILFQEGFSQKNTSLPEILTDNPCYIQHNLLRESFQIKYVYKNYTRTYIIYGDRVWKENSKDRIDHLRAKICETGEEINFHCYDFGEKECLPWLVDVKLKDSVLAVTYLFEIANGKNWEIQTKPTFTKYFVLGKNGIFFLTKKVVFQQPEISYTQNKEQLSNLYKKLNELDKINKISGLTFFFQEDSIYWEKLVACIFAGYQDSTKLFLELDKYLITDGGFGDVYFYVYTVYKNVKPVIKNK